MGLRINTNIASLIAQRHVAKATEQIEDSFRKLSSGLRIQQASDDAAGLAISERMRAQIRALDQARRNANEGISLAQTAESSLDGINSVLLRMRELAMQANNGTLGASEKDVLDVEFQSLLAEISRISASSEYAGINLLDGSVTSVSLQVGTGTTAGTDTVSMTLSAMTTGALTLSALSINSTASINAALTNIDTAIDAVTALRGRLGAIANRLQYTVDSIGTHAENLAAAESKIRDVDVAAETARLTKAQVLQQVGLAVLAQANVQPQTALLLLQ
ncbi:MAG: flagellin FliC [Planctomycetes bacterium]|nr:flagellin FliC [Planctomycetota bacterium]